MKCPWPGCGGAVIEIMVHLPHTRHHEQDEAGHWQWWIDEGSDRVGVFYIVRCSEDEHHPYNEEDVPEVITEITDKAYVESS